MLVRAGRLVELLLLLQARGKMTARDLAAELEVSERTVLRDIDSLSGAGVPVFATRGRDGGFELLDDYETGLASPSGWTPQRRGPGRPRRAAVRISPEGRRVAAVMGLLQPLRVRRTVEPDIDGWVEATFRVSSIERSARDVLPLGAEVEVLRPPSLRTRVATMSSMTAALYRD